MIREYWHFAGHVQGVGFRANTARHAQQYQVTGYVQNLSDGRVRVVIEGSAAELTAFRTELLERLQQFIRNSDLHQATATHEFDSFSIRYDLS